MFTLFDVSLRKHDRNISNYLTGAMKMQTTPMTTKTLITVVSFRQRNLHWALQNAKRKVASSLLWIKTFCIWTNAFHNTRHSKTTILSAL